MKNRIFLSHSSSQKGFVEKVANSLGQQKVVLDKLTFREGRKTISEIVEWVDKSGLFVAFLSDDALKSDWVQKELFLAEQKFKENPKTFFPVIIDEKITHKDKRIPEWIKDYNLKYISQPTKVVLLIKQRLREIRWDINPKSKEIQNLFIGRNELVNRLENDLMDIDQTPINCIQVSGLEGIGRRSLIHHYFTKSSIYPHSYVPSVITVDRNNSIEDFILRVANLSIFKFDENLTELTCKTLNEKIDIAVRLINKFKESNEILFVIDNRAIVLPTGDIVDWFDNVLRKLSDANEHDILLVVISLSKILANIKRKHSNLYSINVPELDKSERKNLFKKLVRLENLNLSENDLSYILPQFKGFPEQIFYAIQIIRDGELKALKDNPNILIQYNTEKISSILRKYPEDEIMRQILVVLSMSDMVSYEFIEQIFRDCEKYEEIISTLIRDSIVEHVGVQHEYIHLNSAIIDYVQRLGWKLSDKMRKRILDTSSKIIKLENFGAYDDISEYNLVIKEMLKLDSEKIDIRKILPSHIVNAIRELYNKDKNHVRVCELAKKLLENESYLDPAILRETRYWFCLSLIRMKKIDEFYIEVRKLESRKDQQFLKGFQFRVSGEYIKALGFFVDLIRMDPKFVRARNELVLIYINLDMYTEAMKLAQDSFLQHPENPYYIANYFRCLLKIEGTNAEKKLLELLTSLKDSKNDNARQFYISLKSQYLQRIKNDAISAYHLLKENAVISNNQEIHLQYLDILVHLKKDKELKEEFARIEKLFEVNKEIRSKFNYIRAKTYQSRSKKSFVDNIGKTITEEQSKRIIEEFEINN